MDLIVVDMEGGNRFHAGQAYVAFSRVKKLKGLYILNFNASAIKSSPKVDQEMVRLTEKVAPNVAMLQCRQLVDTHVTFVLLKVRCLLTKLNDLKCDVNFQSADVMCFCETWLSPSQQSPPLRDDFISIRSDRIKPNNKGGVMISVNKVFNPSQTLTFADAGVEGIVTKLLLPSGELVRVVLVYRSPNTPVGTFTGMLASILNGARPQSANPTVVLGDFNDPLLHSPISKLLSSYGYVQLVKSSTTDQGTRLDHVYYNGSLGNVVLEVCDIYYSDHDAVYLSIPLVSEGEGPSSALVTSTDITSNIVLPSDSKCLLSEPHSEPSSVIVAPKPPISTSKPLSSVVDNVVNSAVVTPPVQQVSWPQFRFYQVNEEWQQRWCSELGLPYCSPYNSTRGSATTTLTRPDRQTVLEMMRDGNCLFRSMSYVLTGSQEYYMLVRLLVCNHMYSILHLLVPHIHPHTSVEAYIAHKNMERDYTWGTDVEIFTFANLCQTNVYVYSIQQKCWCVFAPSCSLSNLDVSVESVYFIHLVNHYEVVTAVL